MSTNGPNSYAAHHAASTSVFARTAVLPRHRLLSFLIESAWPKKARITGAEIRGGTDRRVVTTAMIPQPERWLNFSAGSRASRWFSVIDPV
jgi:hypothetical protein